jgi:hypothetical protein
MDELQAVQQMLAEPPPAPAAVELARGRLERAALSGTPSRTRGAGPGWHPHDPVRRSATPRRWPGWLAPVAAAAAVVAVTFASLGLSGVVGYISGGHSASGTGPAAPRQFNPLVPYISYGWLPAGSQPVQGGARPTDVYMSAGTAWGVNAYARGQCPLTNSPRGLNCPGFKLRISQRAPDVAGHPAFWVSPVPDGDPGLAWEYARGGWAELDVPSADPSAVLHGKGKLAREALKVASHVSYSATTRFAFAVQFSGLPGQWRVQEVSNYQTVGRLLNAQEYILTTPSSRFHPHVGDLGVWTNAAYLIVTPAPAGSTCSPHDPAYKTTKVIIHGYHLFLMRTHIGGLPTQELCGARPDGIQFHLQEFGAHPSISVTTLFREHGRLLGTNPANWTKNPIG